jgi:hypothetical protein
MVVALEEYLNKIGPGGTTGGKEGLQARTPE